MWYAFHVLVCVHWIGFSCVSLPDCCDASDEYNSHTRCQNTCWSVDSKLRFSIYVLTHVQFDSKYVARRQRVQLFKNKYPNVKRYSCGLI